MVHELSEKQGRVVSEVVVPGKEGRSFTVKKGQVFRIICPESGQVGDLNLFSLHNFQERFFASKTRQLHRSHLDTGDRLWSCMPYIRPMATIVHDTLDWYGFDKDGGGVHDVIGSRCDPYTKCRLSPSEDNEALNPLGLPAVPNVWHNFHWCCQSNIVRALVQEQKVPLKEAEFLAHDVLNVFMCTGFMRAEKGSDEGRYFMKQSPSAKGDYIEFYADIDLLGVLSACPGGDCGAVHSSHDVPTHPLLVQVRDIRSEVSGEAENGDAPTHSYAAYYGDGNASRHGI